MYIFEVNVGHIIFIIENWWMQSKEHFLFDKYTQIPITIYLFR